MSGATAATAIAAYVAAGVAVVGVGLTAYSMTEQAGQQADAFKRQAEIDTQNAEIAKQQGVAAQVQQQQRTAVLAGAARAQYGASGVSIEGSPLDVLANGAMSAQQDLQNIEYRTKLKMAGYTNDANLNDASASNALMSGYGKAGGALLSGAASAFSKIPTGSTTYNSSNTFGGGDYGAALYNPGANSGVTEPF
jgi:hypothetical protein